MNKYILINQNDIITSAENLAQAQELATNLATQSGKNITIAQIKCIAQHTIVFSSLDESEIKNDTTAQTEKTLSSRKRYSKTPIGEVTEDTKTVKDIPIVDHGLNSNEEDVKQQDLKFSEFLNEFKSALDKTSSIIEHSNVSQDYKDSIELLTNEQKHIISDIKKSNVFRVGIKDISIELCSVKTEKDLNYILKRYPDNIKADESVKKLIDSLLDEFQKELAPIVNVESVAMDEEVFNKLLNDYQTKLKTTNLFMEFESVVDDFTSIFVNLSTEQIAALKAVETLNHKRIDNSLKALLSKETKKVETLDELKAIETDELPPVFDEKDFKDKCKEAFSHAHTKSRLEEYRDHLLEENKDFDKVAKPIIFTAFYERLSNLQTSKPKYAASV